jgi:hypothetical protein
MCFITAKLQNKHPARQTESLVQKMVTIVLLGLDLGKSENLIQSRTELDQYLSHIQNFGRHEDD